MKFKIYLVAMFVTLFSVSSQAATTMTREQQQARIVQIQQRVQEIQHIDRSQLTSVQRKGLKVELKDMRKEMKSMDPVVFVISGLGLVLIIILLILLL
jgi:hypothetical protein